LSLGRTPASDVGASFQQAVADVLTRKAVQACWQHSVTDLLIGGGVRPTQGLRGQYLEKLNSTPGIDLATVRKLLSWSRIRPRWLVSADRAAGQPCGWLGSGSMAAAVADVLRGGPGA
jgi:tRNA N6-adenosine threonylcarbamoyltransferase